MFIVISPRTGSSSSCCGSMWLPSCKEVGAAMFGAHRNFARTTMCSGAALAGE